MEVCFLIHLKLKEIIVQTVFDFGACGLGKLVHYARISSFADKVPDLLRRWRLLGKGVAKNFSGKVVMAAKGALQRPFYAYLCFTQSIR